MHLLRILSYFPDFIVTVISLRYCTGLEAFYALLVIFPSQPQHLVRFIIVTPSFPTSPKAPQKQVGLASHCSHSVQHRFRHGADNQLGVCSISGSSWRSGRGFSERKCLRFSSLDIISGLSAPSLTLPGSLHLLHLQSCSVFSHLFKL